jgi:cell shape-determining protein MreD
MRSTSSKVPHGILGIVPFLLAIFGAVVASLPLGIDGGANAGLPLSLIIVFFWLARRPGLLPSLALLFIGLMHDALSGAPFGLTALAFLAVRAFILEQNVFAFSQSFLLGWIGFAAMCAGVLLFEWLVMSWYLGKFLFAPPFFIELLIGILAYPPIAAICGWLDFKVFGIRKG